MPSQIKELEKIYKSIRDVKYILFEEKNSPYLVVSFAAYFPVKASYSYLTAFDGIPCNRLYILDNFGFEQKGCWYLCENLNFDVEFAVIELIRDVQRQCGIRNENIITIGSSKGGWCALYYALKYNFGYVVAGAPQILLGDYLTEYPQHHKIFYGMVSEISQKNIKLFNSLLLDKIVPNQNINIFLHYGLGDWHLDKHFRSFYKQSQYQILNLFIDIKLYTGHQEVMNFFPEFLHNTVATIVRGNSAVCMKEKVNFFDTLDRLLADITVRTIIKVRDKTNITVELPLSLDNTQFAIYLLDLYNQPIHKTIFQKESRFEIADVDTVNIRAVQIFFRNSLGELRTKVKQL